MGNSCGKNAKPQATAPQTAEETGKQIERLREKKERLAEELAVWRPKNQQEVEELELRIDQAQQEAEITRGDGGFSPITKERVAQEIDPEAVKLERQQKELYNTFSEILLDSRNSTADNADYQKDLQSALTANVAELNQIFDRFKKTAAGLESAPSKDQLDEHNLAVIAQYYKPIVMPKSLGEVIRQIRIDCAECSLQSATNIKALIRQLRTGDTSGYMRRPMRTLATQLLHLGDKPHNRWACDLCGMTDASDLPLLM